MIALLVYAVGDDDVISQIGFPILNNMSAVFEETLLDRCHRGIDSVPRNWQVFLRFEQKAFGKIKWRAFGMWLEN